MSILTAMLPNMGLHMISPGIVIQYLNVTFADARAGHASSDEGVARGSTMLRWRSDVEDDFSPWPYNTGASDRALIYGSMPEAVEMV